MKKIYIKPCLEIEETEMVSICVGSEVKSGRYSDLGGGTSPTVNSSGDEGYDNGRDTDGNGSRSKFGYTSWNCWDDEDDEF